MWNMWECLLSYEKCPKTFLNANPLPHFVIVFPGGKAERVVMCARLESAALSDCPPDSTQCSNDPSTSRHLQSSVPSLSLDEESEWNPSGAHHQWITGLWAEGNDAHEVEGIRAQRYWYRWTCADGHVRLYTADSHVKQLKKDDLKTIWNST